MGERWRRDGERVCGDLGKEKDWWTDMKENDVRLPYLTLGNFDIGSAREREGERERGLSDGRGLLIRQGKARQGRNVNASGFSGFMCVEKVRR